MAQTVSEHEPTPTDKHPHRLTGADAFRLHLTLTLGLALCIGAFIFELLRALGGHTFSWMYVFEWPLFGGFALYLWWNLYNGTDRHRPSPPVPSAATVSSDGQDVVHTAAEQEPDADLEAWNRYLLMMELEEITAEDAGNDG